MKSLSRLVWSEGMYLAHHHFQAQSRFFEDSIEFAASALWPHGYGFSGVEMDSDALQNGTVAVRHARGIFPDGLVFDLPESDHSPEPRAIGNLISPTTDASVVFLAIPARRASGGNVLRNDALNGDARFIAEPRMLPDETTGADECAIEVGRKNLRLVLDTEPAGALIKLPLARVRRAGANRFAYDPAFVPPVLTIAGSNALVDMLRNLVQLLEDKSRDSREARAGGQSLAEHYRRDLLGLWYLHNVHSSLGILRHSLLSKRPHPEELFCELLRIAGGLSCFAMNADVRELPKYNHDDLAGCFEGLNQKIRAWLEIVLPTRCRTIALEPSGPYYWNATVADRKLFGNTRWILEIRSKTADAALGSQVPRLVKVCSHRFVAELVRRAVPGLPLTYLPAPPPEVPARADAHYFSVSGAGPCWDDIENTHQLGVYVPGNFPDAQLALHVVLAG